MALWILSGTTRVSKLLNNKRNSELQDFIVQTCLLYDNVRVK